MIPSRRHYIDDFRVICTQPWINRDSSLVRKGSNGIDEEDAPSRERGRVNDGVYRTKRDEKEEGEIGEQMRSTIAKPDVLRLLIPGMADSIIHRFANSSNIGVAVALQPLRHLSS